MVVVVVVMLMMVLVVLAVVLMAQPLPQPQPKHRTIQCTPTFTKRPIFGAQTLGLAFTAVLDLAAWRPVEAVAKTGKTIKSNAVKALSCFIEGHSKKW